MPELPQDVPAGYTLAHRFRLTEKRPLLWMNVVGLLIFVIALAVAFTGLLLYDALGSPLVAPAQPVSLSLWWYVVMAVGTLAAHEGLHGLTILAAGHRPRFGVKLRRLVLYTTADAYFTRPQYLRVTLAPLVGITLIGLAAMLLIPKGIAAWVGIMVAMNAASSIGDLWMAAVTASFPANALFHDEEDGMSIFLPGG